MAYKKEARPIQPVATSVAVKSSEGQTSSQVKWIVCGGSGRFVALNSLMRRERQTSFELFKSGSPNPPVLRQVNFKWRA